MKNTLIIMIIVIILSGCAAKTPPESVRMPNTGQWIDPQTNIRFTLENKDGVIAVTAAKDMDDREELVILESTFELGVLRWSYYIPSTKFTVRCRTLDFSDNTMNISWDNNVMKGTETLRRLK